MSLEVFVRAAGAAMGLARDGFGTGAASEVAPARTAPAVPGGPAPGSGQAAAAFGTESGRLSGHSVALGEQDGRANAQFARAVASAASGRDRMNSVIAGATADVHALAPAATTSPGRQALVSALTRRLTDTQRVLADGHAEASTHAAGSHVSAADYRALAQSLPSGPASTVPASGSMGAMPLAGLSSLLVTQPGGLGGDSTGGRSATHRAAGTAGNAIESVLSRALSQHGTPYSWGGGGRRGPGRGDDGTVGFDCSSLMQYAFAGVGVDLPRTTYQQIGVGRSVSPGDIQPGDLIFSQFGEGGNPGPGHVQLAISSTHVVEAPHPGAEVRVTAIPAGQVVVRRILM